MKNSKKVIFTSALLAGAAITVSAADITSNNSGYADLGTGAELRTHILYSGESDLAISVFEMKCAAKEKEGDKKGKAVETSKTKEGKAVEGKCGEGKCGEGKCGTEDGKAKSKTTDVKSAKVDAKSATGESKAKAGDAKVKSEKKAKDSKSKEAKCGVE